MRRPFRASRPRFKALLEFGAEILTNAKNPLSRVGTLYVLEGSQKGGVLYEDLRAEGFQFEIEPGRVKLIDPDDPMGRATFVVGDIRVRYSGAAGFAVRKSTNEEMYLSSLASVMDFLDAQKRQSEIRAETNR
jgi:hypothetical protein